MPDSAHTTGNTGTGIAAIVLAAGGSARLGFPKQLIEVEGSTLVERAASSAREAGAYPIVVVLGAKADAVSRALNRMSDVQCVINERWETGIASSLAVGIRGISGSEGAVTADGVLVMLADQPLIDSESLRRLLDRFRQGHRLVASAYAGIVGVPIVVGKELLGELVTLKGDVGAGQWLRSRDDVVAVPMPLAEIDIDFPADAGLLKAGNFAGSPQTTGIQ